MKDQDNILRHELANLVLFISEDYDVRCQSGEPVAHVRDWFVEISLCTRFNFPLPGIIR